jgi:hypothetical protein
MYVELKTGHSDNGPAWIGKVRFSKTGQTAYYRGLEMRRNNRAGGNYMDVKTGEMYWISGVKRDGTDRHWAGSGAVQIDPEVRAAYLELVDPKVAAKLRR